MCLLEAISSPRYTTPMSGMSMHAYAYVVEMSEVSVTYPDPYTLLTTPTPTTTSSYCTLTSPTGDICVNTLKKDWKPETTLKHVLQVTYEPLDP